MIRGYLKHNKISFLGKIKIFKIWTYVVLVKSQKCSFRSILAGQNVSKIGMVTQYTYRHVVLSELVIRTTFIFFWPTLM